MLISIFFGKIKGMWEVMMQQISVGSYFNIMDPDISNYNEVLNYHK